MLSTFGAVLGILIGMGAAGLAMAMPFFHGWLDRNRVREFLAAYGCEMHSATWAPFGPGCFAAHGSIYYVPFRDRQGNEHVAYIRAGMFSGVEITQDEVIQWAAPQQVAVPPTM